MNRSEFLESLKSALEGMREQDRQDALDYFDELIKDKTLDRGCSEEEAIADLGPVEEIASSIRQTQPPAQVYKDAQASGQGVRRESNESDYGIKTVTMKASGVRSVLIQTSNVPIELDIILQSLIQFNGYVDRLPLAG